MPSSIEFTTPETAELGDVLLALIVRDSALTPPDGWTSLVSGLGSGTVKLDAFARILENDTPSTATFSSAGSEELQGSLVVLRGTGVLSQLVADSEHAAVTADATPNAPAADTLQAINLALVIYSAADAIDFGAPSGFETIDEYTSADVSERTIMLAYKVIGSTGSYTPPAATASPAATGRAFTLVLSSGLPVRPDPLIDLVPGNIGLRA